MRHRANIQPTPCSTHPRPTTVVSFQLLLSLAQRFVSITNGRAFQVLILREPAGGALDPESTLRLPWIPSVCLSPPSAHQPPTQPVRPFHSDSLLDTRGTSFLSLSPAPLQLRSGDDQLHRFGRCCLSYPAAAEPHCLSTWAPSGNPPIAHFRASKPRNEHHGRTAIRLCR